MSEATGRKVLAFAGGLILACIVACAIGVAGCGDECDGCQTAEDQCYMCHANCVCLASEEKQRCSDSCSKNDEGCAATDCPLYCTEGRNAYSDAYNYGWCLGEGESEAEAEAEAESEGETCCGAGDSCNYACDGVCDCSGAAAWDDCDCTCDGAPDDVCDCVDAPECRDCDSNDVSCDDNGICGPGEGDGCYDCRADYC